MKTRNWVASYLALGAPDKRKYTFITTGHSFGGALANLFAFDIGFARYTKKALVSNMQRLAVFGFATPAVALGNEAQKQYAILLKSRRINA
jgi:alpha-beta hydrolase superfamily lysophospholipase